MNIKLTIIDKINIKLKRIVFGWKIKDIAKKYSVTTRTIYRVLKK